MTGTTPLDCSVPNLPVELWHSVFMLACTDGGQTGCSLSRVSRRFAAISMPVRYRCLAVHGKRQLLALIAVLETCAQPPDVRHLFVTDCKAGDGAPQECYNKEGQHALGTAIDRLLALAAHSLCSLSLHLRRQYSLAQYGFTTPLPSVRALSTSEVYAWFTLPGRPLFAELECLHLVGGAHRETQLPALGGMKHLRLSDATKSSVMINMVPQLLRATPESPAPKLCSIIVQPRWMGQGRRCGSGLSHIAMISRLAGLRAESGRGVEGDPAFILLQQQRYDSTLAEWDWRDFVQGGEGCWTFALDDVPAPANQTTPRDLPDTTFKGDMDMHRSLMYHPVLGQDTGHTG